MTEPKATALQASAFASVARAALEKHVPEATKGSAAWASRPTWCGSAGTATTAPTSTSDFAAISDG